MVSFILGAEDIAVNNTKLLLTHSFHYVWERSTNHIDIWSTREKAIKTKKRIRRKDRK